MRTGHSRFTIRFSVTEDTKTYYGVSTGMTNEEEISFGVKNKEGMTTEKALDLLEEIVMEKTGRDNPYNAVSIRVLDEEANEEMTHQTGEQYVTVEDVKQRTYSWNDVDVKDVRYVSHIDGFDGRVLVNIQDPASGKTNEMIREYVGRVAKSFRIHAFLSLVAG